METISESLDRFAGGTGAIFLFLPQHFCCTWNRFPAAARHGFLFTVKKLSLLLG
jgi:hypothetical protein